MKQKISIRAIIKKDDQVLLARRSSGRDSILGKYELPGGSLDFKEQPVDALNRCLKAQIGGEVETKQLFDVISFIDPDNPELQYVFVVYQVSLVPGHLVAQGRYDKYLWQELQNIQQSNVTNSTAVILALLPLTNKTLVSVKDGTIVEDNKTTEKITMYSDGGSRGNPGPSASAFVLLGHDNQVIDQAGSYLGVTTNNQAEYQAVRQGLKRAAELGFNRLEAKLDSALVVNQLNGIYRIKNRDLWPIHEDIKSIALGFEHISFSHVPR
ncbi:MAG: reverse transcriptase-like protein, partial [Segetibacter sp.]